RVLEHAGQADEQGGGEADDEAAAEDAEDDLAVGFHFGLRIWGPVTRSSRGVPFRERARARARAGSRRKALSIECIQCTPGSPECGTIWTSASSGPPATSATPAPHRPPPTCARCGPGCAS